MHILEIWPRTITLYTQNNQTQLGNDHIDNTPIYEELDKEITLDEINKKKAVEHLKRGKSHGVDGILNECFLVGGDILLPELCSLFNNILDSGLFPLNGRLLS